MKSCYYLLLALLFLVITPVTAADMYCEMIAPAGRKFEYTDRRS